MMKANHYRTLLIVLFFGGLLAMWGLDLSGVRPRSERDRRADRVLTDLADTPDEAIRRVEIDRGAEHMVFERRGDTLGRWQMLEPRDVAAEPVRLDTLVRNIKDLRKHPDAGTVKGDPVSFGLAPPAAMTTVRLYAGPTGSAAAERPVAELEIGKSRDDRRYVRPVGGEIEVVGARLLSAVDEPAVAWRQPHIMPAPSFQITSVRVIRRDQEGGGRSRVIQAERGPSGRWKLELPVESTPDAPRKTPLEVLANGPKVESLLGALSSLNVADPPRGYVDDDVKDIKDMARYGLDRPDISVELKTERGPLVLEIGKTVPDHPGRRYVRQGDQNDVVMVEARALSEVPADATALRSQQVAEIDPRSVAEIEIGTIRDVFKLRKGKDGWDLTSPRKDRADGQAVQEFLTHIQELQASEFLEPKKVPNPMLDPPVMTIKIRQGAPARAAAGRAESETTTALDLRLGLHDVLKKTIYARLEGDDVILALPDKIREVLPQNPLAFRDRSVIRTERPDRFKRLTIRRGSRVDELVPDTKGEPNAWRMLRPVADRADTATITQVLTLLCGLRAQDFAAPTIAEKDSGLDRPLMEIDWESDGSHHLKIGAPVPRTATFYATSDGEPMVFTLPATTVRALDAEYRDHRVMSFDPARAGRIVLHFFGRTLALHYRPPQQRGQVEWVPEPDSDAGGIDLSRIGSLIQTMAHLQTRRFIQYEGEIPADTGLLRPRLTVEVTGSDKVPVAVLRIGANAGDGTVCAAQGTGNQGPAFLLPAPSWNELIRSGERLPTLPDDVFAPL